MASKQREISRLIAQAGQMLLAHGAESTLVGDITRRIGIAAGVDEVEVSLSASSLVVTTVYQDHCITTARRSQIAVLTCALSPKCSVFASCWKRAYWITNWLR